MPARLAGRRNGERRNAEEIALDRGGHRARIDRVVAHVCAEVDARHDHVRREVEQSGHGDMHAIGGRAVHREVAVRRAPYDKRPVERERIGRAGGVALGRDHRHFAQAGERLGEQRDAGGEVAVVVRDEDSHANDSTVRRCLSPVRLGLLCLLVLPLAAYARLDYRVEIEAPREMKATLEKGLNIVRWRLDPEMDAERLKRLADEAVQEARETAATEGYFSAQVRAEIDSRAEPWVVRLRVEPGERTRVGEVDIRFTGPAAADGEARQHLRKVRENWLLRGGQPFRQEDWEAAKRTAVRELAGWRYAAASITQSRAAVDPAAHRADLVVELASGPPFRFGELKVNGTKRYTDRLIENLTPVRPGEPYDREKVILYQRRLLESGYFASVQADIDADPRLADAAPLRVGVIDAPKHHFESGIGDNTDVGSRITPRY